MYKAGNKELEREARIPSWLSSMCIYPSLHDRAWKTSGQMVSMLATGSRSFGEGSHTQVVVLVHRAACGGMPEEVAFPVCRMPVKHTRATERARYITRGQGRHLDDIPALGHGDMWNNWTGLVSLMEIKLVRNDMRPHQSQNFINTAQRPQQKSLLMFAFHPWLETAHSGPFILSWLFVFLFGSVGQPEAAHNAESGGRQGLC